MDDRERNLGRLSDEMDDLAESFINGNHNHVVYKLIGRGHCSNPPVAALLAVGIYQRLAQHDSDLNDAHQLTTEQFQRTLESRF